MSSATSTSPAHHAAAPGEPGAPAAGIRPWQFFLVAGMLGATATVVVATGQAPGGIVLLSLTVVAASFVGLAAYRTFVPLVGEETAETGVVLQGRTRAALEREKTLVLRSIKELEFDHAMGKVADPDFEEMGARLRARAVGLMRQLDAGSGYRATIERELESRLGPLAAEAAAPAGAAAKAEQYCTQCGTGNDADAKFCKRCGFKLSA
ncbi:MAG: zinc ribbon domain-containing protein [Vicinamibacterales bacterium]